MNTNTDSKFKPDSVDPAEPLPPGGITHRVRHLIRTRLTTGLLTILPILITIWVLRVIFVWLRDSSLWAVELYLMSYGRDTLAGWGVTPDQLKSEGIKALPGAIEWGVSILSVLLTFVLLYIVGLFTANFIGRRTLLAIEQLFDRLPFVKSIYRLLKQVAELFSANQKQQFQRVALVKFPNAESRVVAFVTNTFRDTRTGAEMITVFMPTTPNPTTGFLFITPRSEVIELDWNVEEAIKAIISGGIVLPGAVTLSPSEPPSAPLQPSRVP
jgi:uncharacterized membrane protein